MGNPFSLSFGSRPEQYVSRNYVNPTIVNTFCSQTPSSRVFLFTGVRGSGKTAAMTDVASFIRKEKEWLVIELDPEEDLLSNLLYQLISLTRKNFPELKEIEVQGLHFSVGKQEDNTPVSVRLDEVLSALTKKRKRVLILIDEVINNENVRRFTRAFQRMIRSELDVYLLMTGLNDNIEELQEDRSLTFLSRAPRIAMEPLDLWETSERYRQVFHISKEESDRMAKDTKGYAFAFQSLGYEKWEHPQYDREKLLQAMDKHLREGVYRKFWGQLTPKDREIVLYLARQQNETRIKEVREACGLNSSQFSFYREKLIRKGLVDVSHYGFIRLSLPRFGLYVLEQEAFDSL